MVTSSSKELVALAALAKGASEAEIVSAVKRVAEAATDFSWLSKGDVVLLKPVSNSRHVYPATTSPLAVRALAGLLREKGAGRIILGEKSGVQSVYQDERGQRGSTRKLLRHNGLYQTALESGAEIHCFEEAGFDAYFGDRTAHPGHWQGELMLPNILTQVDHVILLPRVSRHALAGSTLGLKAAVGWLRDDSRLELHRDARSFLEKIVEINDATILRQKLRLILSVATKVQTTFGPDVGFAAEPDPGLVFSAESLLAHDMAALAWLLWNREHETPRVHLSWVGDPYQLWPGFMNRAFVGYIWGVREFWNSETYKSIPLTSVSTDPQLSRAASLWGGMPQIDLEDVSGMLPEGIRSYLLKKASS